ncbi:MAG: hypothetical protein HUU38_09830 [Anaerolineales bacterium]|nr:hypothetical protein [Anaerolineales bacterium]
MQAISRGFSFLKQSWQMAFADRDLLKPTIYAIFVGMIVSVIGLIPIIGTALIFGDEGIGRYLLYIEGAVLVFVQYVVTYIFSGMTIYLIYGYLSEGDGRMDKAWAVVRRDFLDILSLAGASTLVNLLQNAVRGRGGRGGAIRGVIANIIQTVWTEATYLVLPAMVIEDINLKDGLKRATQIVKNNLLLVGVSTVGVGFATGLIGFFLSATGIVLGLGVGFGIVSVLGSASEVIGLIAGITIGGMIALTFILIAVVIGNYTTTAYHTCLYLWAMEVEKAGGMSVQNIRAPGPLGAVLR